VIPRVTSFFRWEGNVQSTREYMILIKTTTVRYSQAQDRIKTLHPYELPEIIGWLCTEASDEYTQWVIQNTK
jgi:periplasmic divalent cation tolerance protein